jgi:hypothetical protein
VLAPIAWAAIYRLPPDITYRVDGIECTECPVSLINPESFQLVQILSDARHVREQTGAVSFDPNAGEWPPRLYDAAKILAIEDIRINNSLQQALELRSRR